MIEMLMYEGEKVIYQALGLCMYLVLNVGCLMFPVVFLAAKCLFCDYCYGGSECYHRDREQMPTWQPGYRIPLTQASLDQALWNMM